MGISPRPSSRPSAIHLLCHAELQQPYEDFVVRRPAAEQLKAAEELYCALDIEVNRLQEPYVGLAFPSESDERTELSDCGPPLHRAKPPEHGGVDGGCDHNVRKKPIMFLEPGLQSVQFRTR